MVFVSCLLFCALTEQSKTTLLLLWQGNLVDPSLMMFFFLSEILFS
jgi:hypothetical protein